MSNVPGDRRYTKSHEWVRPLDDDSVEIGITDFAQKALGDLVFVDVPEAGRSVAVGDVLAVVESVKAASDVYSPLEGEMLAGNESLGTQPELVNQEPYGEGWIARLKPVSHKEIDGLMDAAQYAEFLASQA